MLFASTQGYSAMIILKNSFFAAEWDFAIALVALVLFATNAAA